MTLWSLSGHALVMTLPQPILQPVLPFVDRYVAVTEHGGEPVAITRAGVAAADGRISIRYELPAALFDCRTRRIEADCLLVKDGRTSLVLEPRDRDGGRLVPALPDPAGVVGAVDYFDGERVRGWAHRAADGDDQPVTVGVFLDDVLVASVVADGRRRDFERKRNGRGRIGFQCGLPPLLFDGGARVLCCASLQTLQPLRNTPVRVDAAYIETRVLALIEARLGKLERLLD